MRTNLKISITTGDVDGIGLEVAQKALLRRGPKRGSHFLLWRGSNSFPKSLKKLASSFKIVSFESAERALDYLLSEKMSHDQIVEIISKDSPAKWVELSAKWCSQKNLHGLVTGPISKAEIFKSGLKDMGHTEILKRVSGTDAVFMGFLGQEFNVVLATAHIPLALVPKSLTADLLIKALGAANLLRQKLSLSDQKKPIALLGLNPHAGELGLIGTEETKLFSSLRKEAGRLKIPLSEPLCPDAAFQKNNWNHYSVYLAMYHDQGLIPFKMIHGKLGGVHISLGLPFVRTSVDHGTAKDIFAKNKANSASMFEAIDTCVKLVNSSINQNSYK